ncbi:MAG TPA: GNAT family N-acetyltransferase [Thermoplasmata archaeon]|nr:GNAT family N-acetyltransferase [Thermoplasmata archaeon]
MEPKMCEPQTEKEFEKYYELRWKMLRKPWNQPKGSEKDEREGESTHIMARTDDKVVGVGRVHFNSIAEAQVRYMAVEEGYQGGGIGGLILKALEGRVEKKGVKYIVLDARENAVGFYKKHGYRIIAKSYLLFGCIQHWKMRKDL